MRRFEYLLLLGAVLLAVAAFGETCRLDCSSGECKQIDCVNGECDEGGTCSCLPCYKGESCEIYDDRFYPYFAKREETIYIVENQQGEIYLANAIDEDSFLQCMEHRSRPCPCNIVQYDISGGTGFSRFSINATTGQVTVDEGEELYEGEEYELIISVSPAKPSGDSVKDVAATMVVRIIVQEETEYYTQFNIAHDISPGDDESHIRRKRSSYGADRSQVNMSLVLLNTVIEPVRAGATMKFELTIILPTILQAADDFDLIVEIFTMDTVSQTSTMALCNVELAPIGDQIMNKATGMLLAAADVGIIKHTNTQFQTFYDRATFDFGIIYNADSATGTDYNPSSIKILFESTVIINPDFANDTLSVTAGADYDNSKRIWVSQAIATWSSTVDESAFTYDITFTGPDTIPQYSAGYFHFDAFVPYPFGDAMVEAYTTSEYHDEFSIETLEVVKVGSNHGCALGENHVTFSKSMTAKTNHRATCSFTQLIGNLDYSNLAAESSNEKNRLIVGFSAFFYNVEPGTIVTLGVGMIVKNVIIWTAFGNVTIGPPGPPPAASPPLSMTFAALDTSNGNNPKVALNQAATWALKFILPRAGNALIDCTATAPILHIVSGIRFGKAGMQVARLPNLATLITYIAGGAAWQVNVNTSTVEGTPDLSEDYVEFEVTVVYLTASPADVTVTCGSNTATLTAVASGETPSEDVSGTAVLLGVNNASYVGAQFAMMATLNFPANGIGYDNIAFESAGDFGVTAFGAKVCKLEVLHPGRAISSVLLGASAIEGNMETNLTSTNSMYMDSATTAFGAVASGVRTNGDASDYKVKIRVVYKIPQPQTVTGGSYTPSVGLLFDTTTIWTGNAPLTIDSEPPAYDPTTAIRFLFHQPDPLVSLATVAAKVYAKMYPGSNSILKYTFTSPDSSLLKICKVAITNMGSNYACLDTEIYGRETDPTATIKVSHDTADPALSATIDFRVLKNLGEGEASTSIVPDENTIEVAVYMTVVSSTTLTITSEDGRDTPLVTAMLLAPSGTPIESTTALTYNVTGKDGESTDFYENAMKEIELTLIIPKGYQRTVWIETQNTKPEEITICYAALVGAGMNLPCLDHKSINTTQETGTNGENVFMIDIGIVCHYVVSQKDIENLVIVRFGVQVKTGITETSFNILINESNTTPVVVPVSLTSAGEYVLPGNLSYTGLKMALLNEATQVVEPGLEYWVGVSIELPKYGTFPIQIAVITDSKDGHAMSTIHGIRWGKNRGANLGCFKMIDEYPIEYLQNSSIDGVAMIHASQKDTMLVDLMYLTNTGISSHLVQELPGDNQFELEARVLIADHDALANGDFIPVSFAMRIGNELVAVIEKNLTLQKTGSEIMKISTDFVLINDTTGNYKQKDQLTVSGSLRHVANESQREAYGAKIRILVPIYLIFVNSSDPAKPADLPADTWNVNVPAELYNNHYMDIDISHLFFTDVIDFNISFTIDPYEALPKGIEVLNSSTLMRLVCRESSLTNPAKYCISTEHVNYQCEGSGCVLDLNVEDFMPCQFTASNAIDESLGPEKVVTSGGWSPAVRDPTMWKRDITIDFLKKTRVTKIIFNPVMGRRTVQTFSLDYSMDGVIFYPACPDVLTSADEILPKHCEIIARFAKLSIVSLNDPDETKSIGVSLKFYGCYKEKKNGTCTLPKTTFANTITNGRHAAVGNGVVYFCDKTPKRFEPFCFSSADGSTWNALPGYIGEIAGFALGKMYAYDLKRTIMVASTDGIKWDLVDNDEKASALGSLIPPLVVKGDSATAIGDIQLDANWIADFAGLKYNGILKAKWDSCCN